MKFYSWTSGFHIWTQLILWWIFVSIQSWTGAVLFTAIRETAERVQWHFHVIILQVFLCCAVFYLYITLFWMQMPYSVLQDALVTLRLLCSSTFHSWTNILIAFFSTTTMLMKVDNHVKVKHRSAMKAATPPTWSSTLVFMRGSQSKEVDLH